MSALPVLLGVRQGSVLSPLLFNIVLDFLTSKIVQKILLSFRLANERVAKLQKLFDK